MKKIEKVLIALDYDQSAKKVAETGFALVKAMGAKAILLHIITDPVYYASTEYSPIMGFTGNMDNYPLSSENTEDLKKATLHFLEKFKQNLGDETTLTMVKEGAFSESILKAAAELKVDIIVIGTHSRKWLENVLLGSVTEEVLRHTKIPLLIVPTKKQD